MATGNATTWRPLVGRSCFDREGGCLFDAKEELDGMRMVITSHTANHVSHT